MQLRVIMVLISCEECGTEISDKAPSCPKCGIPMSKESSQQSTIKNIDLKNEQKFNLRILICVMLFFSSLFLYHQYTLAEKAADEHMDEYFDCLDAMYYSCDEENRDWEYEREDQESVGCICGAFTIMFVLSLMYLYEKSYTGPQWKWK
jgi:hypothetical protein